MADFSMGGEGAMSGSDAQQLQKLRKRLGLRLDDEARLERSGAVAQVMGVAQ